MHYPLYELDRYRTRTMAAPCRLRCRIHLSRCRRCRARMQRLLSRHGIEATTYTYPYGAILDLRESARRMGVPEHPQELRRLGGLISGREDRRNPAV